MRQQLFAFTKKRSLLGSMVGQAVIMTKPFNNNDKISVRLTSYQLSVVQMTLKGCPSLTRTSVGLTFFTLKALTAPTSSRLKTMTFMLVCSESLSLWSDV